jgi:hypothetical protein
MPKAAAREPGGASVWFVALMNAVDTLKDPQESRGGIRISFETLPHPEGWAQLLEHRSQRMLQSR